MKEALFKKRYGIPALLLIVILLTAGSAAAVIIKSFGFATTVVEPLSFKTTEGPHAIYPGESDTFSVHVSNTNDRSGYGIFVNCTLVSGRVKSLTYSTRNLVVSEPQGTALNKDGDMFDARYNIDPGNSFEIDVTIDSAKGAKAGIVEVTLDFHRKPVYAAPE